MVTKGSVMTGAGAMNADDLGITLTHEHLVADTSCWRLPPRTERQRRIADQPISMEILSDVRRDATIFIDNMILDDAPLVISELSEFTALGGRTVVELTVGGLKPNHRKAREIARAAGVNIVFGCGYYIERSHPANVKHETVDSLAQGFIDTIQRGFEGTDIRPGVIGEIGTSQTVAKDEWKVLRAACLAQQQTGLPLFIHVYPAYDGRTAPEVARFVVREGVRPDKVNICHMDSYLDLEYQKEVLGQGVWVSFDCFGWEVHFDSTNTYRASDSERERVLLELIRQGYEKQLLISQDVAHKTQMLAYGGYGYAHILRHIVPTLMRNGVSKDVIDELLVRNPARLLASQAPGSAA
jgi:phosphotriesterase-related protein